jgi:hypothetical protein
MVETITPVVHGGRARWASAVGLHALGATATAAAFGSALGWLGGALGAPWGRAGALALAGVAAIYALGEMPRRSVPVPQLRRQVPDWWRDEFGWPVAATLYGAGLGIGFLTYLGHGTLLVVSAGAVAIGRPVLGAAILGTFGLARGVSAATSYPVGSPERSRDLVDRLNARPVWPRAVANGAVLIAIAAMAGAIALRSTDGWARFGSAALAIVFAWASLSKVFGPRRWRRSLAAHALPPAVERPAAWVVPVAEGIVPGLTLLGSSRSAALWAIVVLLAFSVELLRVRLRGHARVPCGCFGGRGSIDVKVALARNLGVVVVAIAVAAGVEDVPVLSWPARPGRGEALPVVLAVAGLAVAGLTAWRAGTWLRRGGRV